MKPTIPQGTIPPPISFKKTGKLGAIVRVICGLILFVITGVFSLFFILFAISVFVGERTLGTFEVNYCESTSGKSSKDYNCDGVFVPNDKSISAGSEDISDVPSNTQYEPGDITHAYAVSSIIFYNQIVIKGEEVGAAGSHFSTFVIGVFSGILAYASLMLVSSGRKKLRKSSR